MSKKALTPEQLAQIRALTLAPKAVQIEGAAAILDMSESSFERYVKPDIRCIRRGSMRLYLVRELEQWAEENATRTFEDAA